jgi:hypothetical protein
MSVIDNRKLVWILAGLLLIAAAAFGYTLTRGYGEKKEDVKTAAAEEEDEKSPDQAACASNATYARLKEVAFEEALRLRDGAGGDLDTLAASSVVRMENPVLKSRDDDLNVTVCTGRFILELPPGSEGAFGGQRRLSADIEYAAQAAADRSGLVYQIRGAEPIIYKLAAFNMGGQPLRLPPAETSDSELAEADPDEVAPILEPETPRRSPDVAPPPPPARAAPPPEPRRPAPAPRPAQAPEARTVERPARPSQPVQAPAPRRAEGPAPALRAGTTSNPSFSCRSARTRGERLVCGSTALAAQDRAMSSLFYSVMSGASPRVRAELRRTRDRFLAYRDRCGSEACVADAYEGRIREIRDIAAEEE